MKMPSQFIEIFLVFLVIVEISYVLGDDQRYDDAHSTRVAEPKSHTDNLLQTDDGRENRRKGRVVVKRRHAMRNRRDWMDQYNNPYYSQDSSPRQNSFNNQQQPQNQQPQYQQSQNQQPQNYNYQQQQNYNNQPPQNYNYQQHQNQQPQNYNNLPPQNYNYQQHQNQQPQNYNYQTPQIPFSIPFLNPSSHQQPHINNYYYPSSVPNVQYYPPYVNPYQQQPLTVGPFIIIQVPYCPESKPTTTPNETFVFETRLNGENESSLVNYNAYNRTKTGVSLESIPPIREPINHPPLFRDDDDDVPYPESNVGALVSAPRTTTTTTSAPRTTTTTRTLRTRRPTTTTTTEAPSYDEDDIFDDSENACASAIVRCCTPNMDMRCFEKSKCPFIFDDPCEELKQAANNIAKQKAMWN